MISKKTIVITLGVISMIGFAARGIIRDSLNSMPVRYVRTTGVFQYLTKDEIKSTVEPFATTSFFSADMQAIQQAVSTLPWVSSVSVKRIWPDAIDIKVHEKKPYVRWGQTSLLSDRGEIFTPKNVSPFKNLPILSGPDRQQLKVLEIMKGIRTELADHSMTLAEFNVNDRWAWHINLTSGMQIKLGRNEQLKKLNRFLKTLKVLGEERVNAIASVDLRYPNGYAISWKPDSPCCDWDNSAITEKVTNDQPKKAAKSKENGKKNRT